MFNNALIHPLPKIMKEHSNYLQAQRCHLDGNLSAMIFIQVNRRFVGGFLTYLSGILIACQHRHAIWMVFYQQFPVPPLKLETLLWYLSNTFSVFRVVLPGKLPSKCLSTLLGTPDPTTKHPNVPQVCM